METLAGKEWLKAQPVGTFVRAADVPGLSTTAASTMLSREERHPEGLVYRATQGLYWRTEIIEIWSGTAYDERVKRWPSDAEVAAFVAGPGIGKTHACAVNTLGWTSQIAAKSMYAVVGRPPSPPNSLIRFYGRSNVLRRQLWPFEITVLEGVWWFDRLKEVWLWEKALEEFDYRLRCILHQHSPSDGRWPLRALHPDRHQLILDVVDAEKHRRPKWYKPRIADVLDVVKTNSHPDALRALVPAA